MDDSILLELNALGYGYKRIAGEYIRLTGQYVSHMTVRDRLTRTTVPPSASGSPPLTSEGKTGDDH